MPVQVDNLQGSHTCLWSGGTPEALGPACRLWARFVSGFVEGNAGANHALVEATSSDRDFTAASRRSPEERKSSVLAPFCASRVGGWLMPGRSLRTSSAASRSPDAVTIAPDLSAGLLAPRTTYLRAAQAVPWRGEMCTPGSRFFTYARSLTPYLCKSAACGCWPRACMNTNQHEPSRGRARYGEDYFSNGIYPDRTTVSDAINVLGEAEMGRRTY